MISYGVYKVIHIVGILMIFLSLGGLAAIAIIGGGNKHSWRMPLALTHGLGMVLTLVAGFGLLARLGIIHGQMPGWAYAKIGIWLVFGLLIAAFKRKPSWSRALWVVMILLGGVAAYLAVNKPF